MIPLYTMTSEPAHAALSQSATELALAMKKFLDSLSQEGITQLPDLFTVQRVSQTQQ